MKTLKLIPLLAALPFIANANVVLKSDGENLLINEKPAQVTQHLYDADDNLLENIQILENAGDHVKALVTIEEKTGLFQITPAGYILGHKFFSEAGGWNDTIYDANCNAIGHTKNSFYSLNFTSYGILSALGSDTHIKFNVYDLEPVKGYLNCGETDKVISGYSDIDYNSTLPNAELTTTISNYFKSIKYPLSIK